MPLVKKKLVVSNLDSRQLSEKIEMEKNYNVGKVVQVGIGELLIKQRS